MTMPGQVTIYRYQPGVPLDKPAARVWPFRH
jgi:hypothetical protein